MKIEDIESLLSADRIFRAVTLPPTMEAAFREEDREHRRRQSVLGLLLGTFFYAMLVSFDWVIAPDVYRLNIYVRFGIGLPVSLAMIWLVLGRGRSGLTYQLAVGVVGAGDAVTLSSVLALSQSPAALAYFSANLIILSFTINLVGLTTRAALAVCAIVTAIMIAAVAFSPFASPGVLISYFFVGTMVTVTCVFANWCLQNERRRTFLTLRRDEMRLRQISRQRDLLERLAAIDPLTGLANRRGFDAMLDGDLTQVPDGAPVAVAMIDIDCFKAFNDTYGHLRGDDVLKAVAHALAENCGPGLRVGRMGGEEFAVALVGADHVALPPLGERLRRAVEALAIPHRRNVAGPMVTISVGFAGGWTSGGAVDRTRLLRIADDALYAAKRSGRNRVVVTVEPLPDIRTRRAS